MTAKALMDANECEALDAWLGPSSPAEFFAGSVDV